MSEDAATRRRVRRIINGLKKAYPDAECALRHESAFQLLAATILSAQCTDQRVNLVTPELFAAYPDAAALAVADVRDVERIIQSTGFFRNKAKNLVACAQMLAERHGGEPPRTIEAMTALAGVGRKTANVVLGTAYGLASGVVVDTHVGRISRRLGLSDRQDPVQVERDLMEAVPKKEWVMYSHRLIHHGRQVCKARKPLCETCPILRNCPQVGVSPRRRDPRADC